MFVERRSIVNGGSGKEMEQSGEVVKVRGQGRGDSNEERSLGD